MGSVDRFARASKKDVLNKLAHMRGRLRMAAGEGDDFAGEFLRRLEALHFPPPDVERERTLRDEADALPERDEIDDEVEAVELRNVRGEPSILA